MEEIITYRRLKSLKSPGISATNPRLLNPTFRHRSQNRKEEAQEDIMGQNVTQYQYMLKDPHLKENYINWATNLRSYDKNKPVDGDHDSVDPPPVFYKSTILEDLRKKENQVTRVNGVNTAEFSQFFGNNRNLPENDVKFLNDLRKVKFQVKANSESVLKHKEIFKNYGGKENTNLPRLLKKTAIKKLSGIDPKDYEEELDGTHKYPEYTYKNLREKNSTLLLSLTKQHDNVSLPGIAWAVGLRSY